MGPRSGQPKSLLQESGASLSFPRLLPVGKSKKIVKKSLPGVLARLGAAGADACPCQSTLAAREGESPHACPCFADKRPSTCTRPGCIPPQPPRTRPHAIHPHARTRENTAPMVTLMMVMSDSDDTLPAKLIHLPSLAASSAAMKKVLSPISLRKMRENAARKPLRPSGPFTSSSCARGVRGGAGEGGHGGRAQRMGAQGVGGGVWGGARDSDAA